VLLIVEGVLDGEDAAPGVAVEDELIEPEAAAHLFDFFGVAGERPEGGVVGLVGVVAAELVVVVDLNACVGQEGLHCFEILVTEAGAAVEQQHFGGTAAEPLGPNLVLALDDRQHTDSCSADTLRIQSVSGRRGVARQLRGGDRCQGFVASRGGEYGCSG